MRFILIFSSFLPRAANVRTEKSREFNRLENADVSPYCCVIFLLALERVLRRSCKATRIGWGQQRFGFQFVSENVKQDLLTIFFQLKIFARFCKFAQHLIFNDRIFISLPEGTEKKETKANFV